MAHISSPLRDQSVINSLITKEANIFRGNPGCPNRRQDHKRWGNNPLWSHKQPNIPGRRSEGRWQNHQSPCDSVGFNGCGDSKVQKAIGRLWTNRICGQWHLRGFKLYMRIYHIHIHIWPITDLPARTSPNSPCPHSSSVADAPQKIQSMRQVGFINIYRYIVNKKKTYRKKLREWWYCTSWGWSFIPWFTGFYIYIPGGWPWDFWTHQQYHLKSQVSWVLSSTQSDHLELPRLASSIHIKVDGVEAWVSWFLFLAQKKWDKVQK